MANPVKTTLPAKVWTKVATNVTTGKVAVQDNAKVYYTYVYCKAVDGSSVVFFS